VRYSFRTSFDKVLSNFAKFPKGVYPLGTIELSNEEWPTLDAFLAGLAEGQQEEQNRSYSGNPEKKIFMHC
jgi:hypothetical protein